MVYIFYKKSKDYFEIKDYVLFHSSGLQEYRLGSSKRLNYRTFYRHLKKCSAVKIDSQAQLYAILQGFTLPELFKSFDFDKCTLFLDGQVIILHQHQV